MPNRHPTPPPKGVGKFAILAGIIVVLMIAVAFFGMNAQHAQSSREQKAGNVTPQEAPMNEKDLGKAPAQQK